MASKSPKPQTVSTDPWSGVQPALRQGIEAAQQYQSAPGSTVAPLSPYTQSAINMMTGPQPLIDAAQQQALQTIGGDYLSGPEAARARDFVLSSVRPGVDATFSSGGRFGSGLHGESLGRGVALGFTPFLEAERSRQLQASAMAPALQQAGYQGQLMAGDIERTQRQAELDEPYTRLARYMGLLPTGGGVQTTTGGVGSNPVLGGLGGLATGAGVASALGPQGLGLMAAGSPWAWPLVLGGGLLGAFG